MNQPLPNLHHLELFYHVAAAKGISAGVRAMPYGIQQPAVSGQIAILEKDLGVILFQRRPFALTPAGEELFDFLQPFFFQLPEVTASICGRGSRQLRLGAPAMVIREYLPAVLERVRRDFPAMELSLVDVSHGEMIRQLQAGLLDLAVIEMEANPSRVLKSEVLTRLPLVLWLPPGMSIPKGGLKDLCHAAPLIRPPTDTVMTRLFETGLKKAGVSWQARMELATSELILEYVAKGFGVGLGHEIPGLKVPKGVTRMPLSGFPRLVIAAVWRKKPGPLVEAVLDGLRKTASSLK